MLTLKKLQLLYIAVGVAVLVGLLWLKSADPTHPEFGRIYTAEMVESDASWQTAWERREAAVRGWMGLRQRQPPAYRGLRIGPSSLEWSLGGYIYMNNPLPPSEPQWEFALSRCPDLHNVTRRDLDCEFYGLNDPRGTNAFGPTVPGIDFYDRRTAWQGHAIRVPDGQVFFARLVTNRSTVYVIQLGRWSYVTNAVGAQNGRIRVKYVEVCEVQARPRNGEPDDPANGSQPFSSETNRTSSAAGSRR